MCVMKLFVALLVRGDTTTAPGRTVPPALYYRFEDAARPGADTMGHHDLLPTAASTLPLPAPTPGGAVGAFAAFDGGNTSEALAAGAGAWNCSASSCDGVTVEFLLRAGPNFNKAGETPVLQSRGEGSAFAFEALLARHAYGLHAGGRACGFPQQLYAGADVLAPLEGVGRAAHGWLLDFPVVYAFLGSAADEGGGSCLARTPLSVCKLTVRGAGPAEAPHVVSSFSLPAADGDPLLRPGVAEWWAMMRGRLESGAARACWRDARLEVQVVQHESVVL